MGGRNQELRGPACIAIRSEHSLQLFAIFRSQGVLRRRTRAEAALLRRQHVDHDIVTDQRIHFHLAARDPHQGEPQGHVLHQTAPEGQDHDPDPDHRP